MPLLTLRQVRERLGVSRATVRGAIDRGHLPVLRLTPRTLRVDPGALATYERLRAAWHKPPPGRPVREVAEALGVPASAVRSWIRSGRITATRSPSGYYVPDAEVARVRAEALAAAS